MANLSGKMLGKVQVGDLIARGGMAEVYLGEHTTLNRKVAVKVMHEHVEADTDNRARFEREAQVLAGLRHPNIIHVFDYELLEGQPCLIMEYVPGASLGNYLKAVHQRGEKLPLPTVARLLTALASAIDYAHQQNVIHRDLKPANVLLRSSSGEAKLGEALPEDTEPILTDFGLVRLLDSTVQTSTGLVSGTPAYMSPEQARGEKLDAKTDIYSLGVMLYEMLAGSVPFDAESSFGVLMKHLNEPPPPIPGISSSLQAVIDRALAKDPHMRYPSAQALADEFNRAFKGDTISEHTANIAKITRVETAKEEPQKTPNPFNWNYLFGGLILLAFIFTGGWYLLRGQKSAEQIVGRVSYSDLNNQLDKAQISTSGIPALEEGKHYSVWYLSQGGETRRNVGILEIGSNQQGQLIFVSPKAQNILESFDQIEITIEPNNDPAPDESSGEIIASSVFPPLALTHVRHLLVKFNGAPEATSLIHGMRRAADELDISVQELEKAYEHGSEGLYRAKLEALINQISGSQSPDYRDWNGDGDIEDPSDGYGLLFNGETGYVEQGYLAQVTSHAKFAAQSLDATENIQVHSGHVITCAQNMEGWSKQIREKARQLQQMPFNAEAKPLIDEITALSIQILIGVDSNGNEHIEPITGEGGAATAYDHAYYLADMPLITGAHQIPSPAAKAK